MTAGFVEQVSAVSPLDGDAIDGSARPKPGGARRSRREPSDRAVTYFCSNPQCDHATWAPIEQARHMAKEFWWVARALVELVPESPEALQLTGGTILRDLSDEELREAHTWARYLSDKGANVPVSLLLRDREYRWRSRTGQIANAGTWKKRTPREMCRKGIHPWIPENITPPNKRGLSQCRPCMRDGINLRRAEVRKLHDIGDHSECQPSRCVTARKEQSA